jgi:signal transduction histidine kinase
MPEYPVPWFSTDQFMPHGTSYLWTNAVIWMNAIPDMLIALACFSIPFVLAYITRRRKDLQMNWLILSFGTGAAACGAMHLLAVWNIWHVEYWIEGLAKIVTAASAIPTAILLWRYLPELLSLPSQRQLQTANERLARANRELEAFTASVSHDLRSPLTTIAGQAGLLELSLGNIANEDQKRRLQRIQSSVKQMSELIDALLVLSRISRHTLRRELVDVNALIDTVVGDLRQRYPSRQIDLKVQSGMSVHGDRRLISDLFANVLSNAWKFTSKNDQARVEIGQKVEGSMSTLFVRDNGAGFDMAYASKLFKPFQRLHSPTEYEGSGVGLATVARIVDRHGGRIWAEARPSEGAIFYFTLPTLPITDELLVEPPVPAASQPAQ